MIANRFTFEVNKRRKATNIEIKSYFCQKKVREKTMNLPLKEKPDLL